MTLYKILSYILLPIAALLGFLGLIALIIAISQPALLLGVFMLVCVAIYTYTSFYFLQNGIITQRKCKPSLKDWIKVNAYVAIAFGVLSVAQSISLLTNPVAIQQVIEQSAEMQSQMSGASTPTDLLQKTTKWLLIVMGVTGVILIAHTFLTFSYLKKFGSAFDESSSN